MLILLSELSIHGHHEWSRPGTALNHLNSLKEGTEVRVRPISSASTAPGENGSLSDMLLSFSGTIEGLPDDMARNHDHYLYGVPKKRE